MLHLSNKLSASLDFRHTQATREELWRKDLFSMNKLKTATLKKKKWTNSIIASIEGTSSPLNPAQVFSRSSPCSSILICLSPPPHMTGLGCWVSSMLKRFFNITRCRENLSSGENRAGWAELVGSPSGVTFCGKRKSVLVLFKGFKSWK